MGFSGCKSFEVLKCPFNFLSKVKTIISHSAVQKEEFTVFILASYHTKMHVQNFYK